jgi:NAD(P)-dependent dehydrogenase (short-subunit alcohol dehydrogenase family)
VPSGLDSRVIAITGGARGIGLATAKALHAAGAKVAIGDLEAETVAAAAASVGSGVLGVRLDVTDESSFAAFLAAAERELGPLDVLINNAGIMPIGPYLDETVTTARRVVEINVVGYLTGMKLALPGMLERGRGHIVNLASVAGKAPVPGGCTYAASKAAVVSMTETMRVEYAGRGLSFTCVMPSFTATDLILGTKGTKFVPSVQPEAVAKAIVKAIARPQKDVYVPGSIGSILKVQALLGRRIRDAMQHSLGADRTFLEVDRAAREPYESRVSRS